MAQARRSLLRRLLHLLVMVSFVASIFAAGKTYFFCRMIGDVQAHCCCASEPAGDGNASLESGRMDCCQLRTHATPGDSAPTVSAPVFVADVALLGAPVAVVPRANVRAERVPLPDWTGPPLDQRRALIPVRLL